MITLLQNKGEVDEEEERVIITFYFCVWIVKAIADNS